MKSRISILIFALCLLLFHTFLPISAFGAEADEKTLTVLFTHDTHDHFLPAPKEGGGTFGGYTRLATLLKEQRAGAKGAVVTLDAGDFSMGSLFQTIYTTDAPELRALGAMGYDVTTFGNHEYDYRAAGLAGMLNAAVTSGDPLPAIVQANYRPPASDTSTLAALERYGVSDYTLIEQEGITVAVFGLLGVDADECAPMSGMEFTPIIDAAKQVVAEIQAKESPDYIICLSHSGTENGKGEDYELAQAVDGIDLIISGHTHSTLTEPIQVNNTLIVSCGEYTHNLGTVTLHKSAKDSLRFSEYRLIPIDDTVAPDPDMVSLTQWFKYKVEHSYLSDYNLEFDQILAAASQDLSIPETGGLIGNAYISIIQEIEGENYIPIAFAVAPNGVIRGALRSGNVTTADAFDILSLGSGADGTPAYPLVSVYLTGKDLKNAFEVDASISDLMSAATLYGGGAQWEYNPHRMFLDRVTDCSIIGPKGTQWRIEIQDDQLYRVVADLYSGQMLGTVESKSYGLLTVTPRDENGDPIVDLESRILYDQDGNELKAWYALAAYLKEEQYIEGPISSGKIVSPSWNPFMLLFPLGLPTLLVLLFFALLIALGFFFYCYLYRRKRRRTR